MTSPSPAIVGLGFAVPARVRTNDDPIFDWIKTNHPDHAELFTGFEERRILSDGETLASLMQVAGQAALDDADVPACEIDLLLGLGSVGDFVSPNTLVETHRNLRLGHHCQVVPLASEFTVFGNALILADAMLRAAHRHRNVLIVCGCDWSRHVSYHEATCIGAADGAGAAVLSRSDDAASFRLVDWAAETDTGYFGAMRMAAREAGAMTPPPPFSPTLYTTPLMYFGEEAETAFEEFGGKVPQKLVNGLLARNGIAAADVCLIPHQATLLLTTLWAKAIQPGQCLTTLTHYANMTTASVAITLAARLADIDRDNLVLLTIGMQQQACALLLTRSRAQ